MTNKEHKLKYLLQHTVPYITLPISWVLRVSNEIVHTYATNDGSDETAHLRSLI